MTETAQCRVGIILEKRPSDNPWIDHEWVTAGMTLDVVEQTDWMLLREVSGAKQFLSPPVTLELHRAESEAYLFNLESPVPSLFAVLREDEESDAQVPFEVHLVTASPYEAQDYQDSSEEHVDRVGMDEAVHIWVERFVDEHHTHEEFKKRRRDKLRVEDHKFGHETLIELRKRMGGDSSGSLH